MSETRPEGRLQTHRKVKEPGPWFLTLDCYGHLRHRGRVRCLPLDQSNPFEQSRVPADLWFN